MSQRIGQSGETGPPSFDEVEAGLEQLALLAAKPLDREAYYAQWVRETVALAAARGGVVWNMRHAGIELLAQFQTEIEHLAASDAFRRRHWHELNQIARAGQAAQLQIEPAAGVAPVSASKSWVTPIQVDGKPVALVEMWYETLSDAGTGQQGIIAAACELAGDYEAQWDRRSLTDQALFWRQLAELAARLPHSSSLELTEQTIVSAARSLVPCTRATLVQVRSPRLVHAKAVSDTPWFERRSGRIRALEELARIVAYDRSAIWHAADLPPVPEDLQSLVQTCLDQSHARLLGAVGLISGSKPTAEANVFAVLVIEASDNEDALDRQRRAEQLAGIAAPALAQAYDQAGLPLLGVSRWLRDTFLLPQRSRWYKLASFFLALILIPTLLIAVPAELEIEARGQILPQQRQNIYAPADGVITSVAISHGQQVRAGTELFVMHSASLEQEATRLRGELDSTQERILALQSARSLNESQAGAAQRAELFRISAELTQLTAVVASYEKQIELVDLQLRQLTVVSPVAGEVLSWQVDREFLARPVNRGQKLVTIAQTTGPWELTLQVPAEDVGYLREAPRGKADPLRVRFVLEADPARELHGTVQQIGQSVRQTEASELVVPVTVSLPQTAIEQARAGAAVRARVACGKQAIGFVWFRQIIRYFQLHWF